MKKIFIVHGFEGKPNGGWRPWLMKELGKIDIYACALAMPTPYHPVLQQWIAEIDRHIKANKKDKIILVGHSLGVPAILNYLQNTKVKNIEGVILVSGPINSMKHKKLAGFFSKPFDFKKIRSKIKHIAIIHGDNDPVVPLKHAKILSKELDGKFIIVKNGKHLNTSAGWLKLPQCLEVLNNIFK